MGDDVSSGGGPFYWPDPPARVNGECFGFAWIGQAFDCCDVCGEPFWEHRYDATIRRDGPHAGKPFRKLIRPERAAAVRANWEGYSRSVEYSRSVGQ